MKMILMVLLLPLRVFSDPYHGAVSSSDLGRGILRANDLGGRCVEGKQTEINAPTKISYRLSVEPHRHQWSYDVDPNRRTVVAKMTISDRILFLSEVVLQNGFAEFERACGSKYLASVTLGASVAHRLVISAEEASKISPLEIVGRSEADLLNFQDAVNSQMDTINSVSGRGIHITGFKDGANFDDFDLSLKDLFGKYLSQWPDGNIERVGQEGSALPYPKR